MLTSSSSFALIGHRTLELYYFIFIFLFFIFYFNLTVVRGRRSSEDGLKMEEKTQVSEVGFEPGTFRSCVGHSNHYATETPPIPDVLLVLVAPKHINRNVTTTLQSRFTPTPTPQATHSSFIILFYYYYLIFFFFFFILFFYFFYFCETSQYLALFAATIFPISTPTRTLHPPPSSLSPPQPALFTPHHLPYLHPNPHSSPPPSSLSPPQPALFTRHHLPYLHPNPHCSPTISIPTRTLHRSLPVSITSGSHLVLFADPLLIWG